MSWHLSGWIPDGIKSRWFERTQSLEEASREGIEEAAFCGCPPPPPHRTAPLPAPLPRQLLAETIRAAATVNYRDAQWMDKREEETSDA